MTEFATFFGFDFEINKIEVEVDNVADFENVFFLDEFIDGVDYHAEAGIFANGFDV